MRLRLLTAIVLALTLPLLASCKTSSRAEVAAQQYVALGDSYTAAAFIGGLAREPGCPRSVNNYPHIVADETGYGLTDVSCNGATTVNIRGEQQVGQVVPPQLDAVTDGVDLVTVGLGFNDFNLAVRIFAGCVQLAANDPDGTPCTDADAAAGEQQVARTLPLIEERLVAGLEDIAAKAPEAKILAIGYPAIYPTDDTCSTLGVAVGDLPFLRSVIDRLNDAIRNAAKATGATYIDVFAATRNHDVCADVPFVAGAEVHPGQTGVLWHPYAEEQRVVADLILAELEN